MKIESCKMDDDQIYTYTYSGNGHKFEVIKEIIKEVTELISLNKDLNSKLNEEKATCLMHAKHLIREKIELEEYIENMEDLINNLNSFKFERIMRKNN